MSIHQNISPILVSGNKRWSLSLNSFQWQQALHIGQDFFPRQSEGRRKQMCSKGAVRSLLGDKKNCMRLCHQKWRFIFVAYSEHIKEHGQWTLKLTLMYPSLGLRNRTQPASWVGPQCLSPITVFVLKIIFKPQGEEGFSHYQRVMKALHLSSAIYTAGQGMSSSLENFPWCLHPTAWVFHAASPCWPWAPSEYTPRPSDT